jgi:hypothetical protein
VHVLARDLDLVLPPRVAEAALWTKFCPWPQESRWMAAETENGRVPGCRDGDDFTITEP